VPAAQAEHAAAPPLDQVPAAHAAQLDAPGPDANVPAGQLLQPPPCKKEPGAQTEHALAPLPAQAPSPQLLHALQPLPLLKVFCGQLLHELQPDWL
jgi:hypothetical protein